MKQIVLGTMNFGGRTPATEATKLVRAAFERGIGHYDTANLYSQGRAETILGEAFREINAIGRVSVTTKVGAGRRGGKPEGLSPAVVREELEASLRRLRLAHRRRVLRPRLRLRHVRPL